MNMMNFLKTRKSTREFKRKNVNDIDLRKIKDVIDETNRELENMNMSVKLFEYGQRIYDSLRGVGGYSGVMIDSPHYIGLDLKEKNNETIMYSGYFMEKIVTQLNNAGLGTCWVSLNDIEDDRKAVIFGEDARGVDYLLAIGYPKPKNPFIHEPFSERIGVEEMVFSNKLGEPISMDELEKRGLGDLLFYIRFAPSTLNKQPWRFIVFDDSIELALVEDNEKVCYEDAGIIMYYFEELAKSQGMNNKWELMYKEETYKDNKYRFIGKYKL